MYYVNGLEYMGRDVKIKGRTMKGVEAKRFVTLKKTESLPSGSDIKDMAKNWTSKEGAKLKKVWVMQMEGNKWKKVKDVIDV